MHAAMEQRNILPYEKQEQQEQGEKYHYAIELHVYIVYIKDHALCHGLHVQIGLSTAGLTSRRGRNYTRLSCTSTSGSNSITTSHNQEV